jgi:hypothetical protein
MMRLDDRSVPSARWADLVGDIACTIRISGAHNGTLSNQVSKNHGVPP